MDFRNRASSNLSSDIVPESWSTDFVKDLVRLQAEAAADDSFWISVVPPKIAMTGVGVDRLSRQQRVLAVHNVHKEDLAGDQALLRQL